VVEAAGRPLEAGGVEEEPMKRWLVVVLALSFIPAAAESQWGAGAPPDASPPPTAIAPSPPPAPAQAPYTAPYARERLGWFFGTFGVGVPFLLTDDRDVVRPGANLHARFAFTSRYAGVGMQASYQWIPIDTAASGVVGGTRDPLLRGAFGPFLHLQAPTPSGVIPYLQGGFDFNFWNFRETAVYCDYWTCFRTDVYRFTPGFHGRAGAQIPLTSWSLMLDLGVEVGMSFPGDFFLENQTWVTPYLGIGYRR